jgi:CBS domain-containing protein
VTRLSQTGNYETGTEGQILVKDVMTSPLITVKENTCIPMVAQLMEHHKIGSLVVTSEQGETLGIITEKDLVVRILTKITDKGLVERVLGEGAHISRLTAGEVMTSPLVVITPDKTLVEAARRMRRHNIRRLGVTSKGKLIGMISNKDILAVTPELVEILREKKKIAEVTLADFSEHSAVAGYCEQCGAWSSRLKESNGNFLCEECTG